MIGYMPSKYFFSGLAGPSTATFKFFTEDIATIIDPNARMEDKAMASLFTFVKPAKFLDTMGDVAGPGLKNFSGSNKASVKPVSNMKEFWDMEFGKSINNSLSKSKVKYDGQSIYKVEKKTDN
ncbi:hypothetical protein [Gracilibacillus thailandensis]|uniref:hypothetical protein n=1 Tax=Gracilibacillus thailandensis TaxID=563735 RepID=UPI001E642D00|nr:hypothetical protein [Gracilibacillus thailandensis]